jgi:hypothetical protein
MDPRIEAEKRQILEQINQIKGLGSYSPKQDPKSQAAMLDRLKDYESSRERHYDEEARMITQALQQAITETVQRIASVIINERRAEIEAACNFGELRDVLAAELARQFMAARFTDRPTPFDPAKVSPGMTTVLRAASHAGQSVGNGTAMPSPGYAKGVTP